MSVRDNPLDVSSINAVHCERSTKIQRRSGGGTGPRHDNISIRVEFKTPILCAIQNLDYDQALTFVPNPVSNLPRA